MIVFRTVGYRLVDKNLVLEKLRGVLDPEITRPACTYPRDIFLNESRNFFVNRALEPMACGWEPPARWVRCPAACVATTDVPVQLVAPQTVAKPAPPRNPSPYSPR